MTQGEILVEIAPCPSACWKGLKRRDIPSSERPRPLSSTTITSISPSGTYFARTRTNPVPEGTKRTAFEICRQTSDAR